MKTPEKKKVIFLDRDGTINIDAGVPVFHPDKWEWTERAIEAMKILLKTGYKLAIVTNQTGIGHKMYTLQDMQSLHDFMEDELRRHGVMVDAIAFCPHRRDAGCACRKPNTDMARQVEEKLGPIDYKESWMIGDKPIDIEFGRRITVHTALIHSPYWKEEELAEKPDLVVDSLYEAAQIITGHD